MLEFLYSPGSGVYVWFPIKASWLTMGYEGLISR